ncbi:MAG TPA: Ig-like domain-containing protein [Gammaproteobacteria bacterium]|nr:Ig-like domain-containing protein [Gammaproteobacteria bacterium]
MSVSAGCRWGCVMVTERLPIPFWLLALFLLVSCSGDAGRFEQAVETAKLGMTGLTVTSLRDFSQRGEKQQFTALADLADGGQEDFSARVNWRVSDPAIGSIDANGLLLALANGAVEVIAEFASFTARKTLTINDATLESLALDTGDTVVDLCLPARLGAVGSYSDGTRREIRDLVDWSVDSANASIVNDGSDKGKLLVSEPTTTINVTLSKDGVAKTASLLVQDNLQAIAISPASASLKVDDQQQFQALGDFLNREQEDITANVKWSSAAPTIASIDGNGLAKGIAAGSATLLASCGGKTGSAQVTVSGNGGFIVQAVYRDRTATFQITVDAGSGLAPPTAPGGSATANCSI